jgi:hypothetical protein
MKNLLGEDKEPNPEDLNEGFVFMPGRYYIAIWFVNLPHPGKYGHGGDVNGLLWRKDGEPNIYYFKYRFRYYKSDQIWDGRDEKVWYLLVIKDKTEQESLDGIQKMLHILSAAMGQKLDTYWINGDSNKAQDLFETKPPVWAHRQQVIAE